MIEHAVIVVGAGPTGLMLAGELALGGVDVAIVERRSTQNVDGMRARGVHARTLELFDQRGIADRFLERGHTFASVAFGWIRMDISGLPSRHPYGLALPQADIESLLAAWVEELGVPIYRDRDVIGFAQTGQGVRVALSDGGHMQSGYLVGCDGGRSVIRKSAGISFEGSGPTISNLLAEVAMTEDPILGLRHDALGVHSIAPEGAKRFRVLVSEDHADRGRDASLEDLRRALIAVYGTDFGVHSPVSLTRFTDAARQATTYRQGRVLLAGDAAHIHYPAGGQGLNLGLQDAVNLGWKLALVTKGMSADALLDSYQAEQHPVAARILRNAMAQVALLGRLDDRKTALREVFSELLAMEEPRQTVGAMMSGLDIRYELGGDSPLLGRRMPDLDLMTSDGATRLFSLLNNARPLLLNFGERDRFARGEWMDSIRAVVAVAEREWTLPVLGNFARPRAVLVRPDGHVAWVEQSDGKGPADILASWFAGSTTACSQSAPSGQLPISAVQRNIAN